MASQLTDELVSELKNEFFLVRRGAFWGALVGILIATGVVSYGAAKTAIATWAKAPVLEKLTEAERQADRLIHGTGLLPKGSILLISKSTPCPENFFQGADFNIQTSKMNPDLHRKSVQASTGDSTWDENKNNWDGRTYRTCILSH